MEDAGMIRGSCLCGAVRFEIEGKVSGISACHCSICRKASGAANNAVLATATRSFRWVSGADRIRTFVREGGDYRTHFCSGCGSPVPALHDNGKIFTIPAGGLEDDPGTRVVRHIFVGSKAAWDEIGDAAPQFAEGDD